MTDSSKFTYKVAGVDINAGNKLVSKIQSIVSNDDNQQAMSSIGGFGGLFELDLKGINDPVLVSGTDGVGTKLNLALKHQSFAGLGIDLVAMCVNDIAVLGAKPLFFLDYYSTQKLIVTQAEAVIKSIYQGCKDASMVLLGGETAEHPISAAKGEFDIAGFCVGIVDKKKIINGSTIAPGDTLIGVGSSGVHANGFSLVHRVLSEINDYDKVLIGGTPIVDVLLTPTFIYSPLILALCQAFNLKGIAHITGGGITENLPRIIPKGLKPVVNKASWERPLIFKWLESMGIDENEMLRTFNCGIGLVIAIDPSNKESLLGMIKKLGHTAVEIGSVAESDSSDTLYE